MAALHEGADFAGRSDLPRGWAQDVFQCCTFSHLEIEGAAFEGILSDCRIENSSWYWGLFNTTKFVDVQFTDCLFRGSAFSGCVFVRCRFSRSAAVLDRPETVRGIDLRNRPLWDGSSRLRGCQSPEGTCSMNS
ncbi:pentapeptide repeat-containing protein [Roseateles terrae]|uniref:pentapeptide repeat-containing protein n=1 Tax=Roseateles terrae TaxID=431060 RepID=UPI00161F9B09